MAVDFEWDLEKAETNQKDHQASTAFEDPLHVVITDPRHSDDEERFVLFGRSSTGRLLAVMHTERGKNMRLISARSVTPKERRQCERGDY